MSLRGNTCGQSPSCLGWHRTGAINALPHVASVHWGSRGGNQSQVMQSTAGRKVTREAWAGQCELQGRPLGNAEVGEASQPALLSLSHGLMELRIGKNSGMKAPTAMPTQDTRYSPSSCTSSCVSYFRNSLVL